jgi:hypothetical protein
MTNAQDTASLAVSSGANLEAVQRMPGHLYASMRLEVYSDLFDEDLVAVAPRRAWDSNHRERSTLWN